MSLVDESVWVRKCPRCKDTSPNTQVPVSNNFPCPHCGKVPWDHPSYKDRRGKNIVLFYRCQTCDIRYLTPRFETREQERLRLAREVHKAQQRLKELEE